MKSERSEEKAKVQGEEEETPAIEGERHVKHARRSTGVKLVAEATGTIESGEQGGEIGGE